MTSRRLRARTVALVAAQATAGILVGLALGWLAVRGLAWRRVGEALAVTSPPLLALALVIFLLALYLRAARWRLLFIGQRVSTLRLLLVENAAIGLNNVSPIRVLSEPAQFGILTLRDQLPPGWVLATMVATRTMDTLVNIVFVGAGLVLFPVLMPFAPYVALGALFSGAGIVILVLAATGNRRLPLVSRLPFARSFYDAVAAMRSSPARVLLALGLSFAYWTMVGLSGWVVVVALDLGPQPLFVIVLVQAVILFSTSVPGLPGAFGTMEFAAVVLLGAWGVPREAAFSYAVLLHLLLFLPPLLLTMVVLPREGMGSVAALRVLLEQWKTKGAGDPPGLREETRAPDPPDSPGHAGCP